MMTTNITLMQALRMQLDAVHSLAVSIQLNSEDEAESDQAADIRAALDELLESLQ